MKYIERNGYLERVWKVRYSIRGFKYCILVRGTEPEMHDYLESEMGFVGVYRALSDKEIDYAEALDIPVYIAPKDPDR